MNLGWSAFWRLKEDHKDFSGGVGGSMLGDITLEKWDGGYMVMDGLWQEATHLGFEIEM